MNNEIAERKDIGDCEDKREILFRGKTTQGGFWKEGCLLYWANQAQIWEKDDDGMTHNYSVEPKTVGQYTGLRDKNGKKIFEGDILSFRGRNLEAKSYLAMVSYEVPMCAFSFKVKRNDGTIYNEWLMDSQWKNDTLEIDGNIYDNPELLEQGNE